MGSNRYQKKPTRKKKAPEHDEQYDGPSLDVELPFWNVDFKEQTVTCKYIYLSLKPQILA